MGPTWEGSYKIIESNRNDAYALETVEGRQIPRTWNARNLKKFSFDEVVDNTGLCVVVLSAPHP